MGSSEPTIEAEVVEIDGVVVEPIRARDDPPKVSHWGQWGTWQGQAKRLDMRWWPLWAVLGFIALVVVVAVGMVTAVLLGAYRIFTGLLNGLAGLLFPSQAIQRR